MKGKKGSKKRFVNKLLICYNIRMEKYFTEYGIVLNEKQKEQFKRYCELLIEYNERFNLTAITEKKEIYIKHFIDSALAVELLKGENLADVGSGGGFPALPLKIIKPELEVTLIEATEKKCEFLKEVAGQLGLTGVKVVCGRAEDLAKNSDYREKFDICTARAVARLNVLAEYCLPFVKKGGIFVAYKGDADDELKDAEKAFKILGGMVINYEKYVLEGAKRSVIIVEKQKNTDVKYPRSNARIKNKPL